MLKLYFQHLRCWLSAVAGALAVADVYAFTGFHALPHVYAVVGTHSVAGVSSIAGPTVNGVHALALVHALAETHAAADVSDVVGPAVTGVLNCIMILHHDVLAVACSSLAHAKKIVINSSWSLSVTCVSRCGKSS
jgi:hypothetical protein